MGDFWVGIGKPACPNPTAILYQNNSGLGSVRLNGCLNVESVKKFGNFLKKKFEMKFYGFLYSMLEDHLHRSRKPFIFVQLWVCKHGLKWKIKVLFYSYVLAFSCALTLAPTKSVVVRVIDYSFILKQHGFRVCEGAKN